MYHHARFIFRFIFCFLHAAGCLLYPICYSVSSHHPNRPEDEVLDGKTYYRVFFPNRKRDDKTPIIQRDDDYLELQIENLGEVPVRTLRWERSLAYPEMPSRRLPTEAEVAERKAAVRAERAARAEAVRAK